MKAGPSRISIGRLTLQTLFDVAVNSMDFGSGFLDAQEAACLRDVADMLGVDKKIATPDNLWMHFPHPWKPWPYTLPGSHIDTEVICYACREVRGNVIHQEVTDGS